MPRALFYDTATGEITYDIDTYSIDCFDRVPWWEISGNSFYGPSGDSMRRANATGAILILLAVLLVLATWRVVLAMLPLDMKH